MPTHAQALHDFPSSFGPFFRWLGKVFLLFNLLLLLVLWRCRLQPDSYFVLAGCFALFTGTGTALIFFGKRAGIFITNGELIVTLGTKTTLPFATITHLQLDLITIGRYTQRQILALSIVSQNTKRTKIHIESFDRYRELMKTITSNTQAKLDISDRAQQYMQQRNISF